MTTMYATVTSKGQVTLPAQLRRMLGITPGQTVGFREENGHVTLEPGSTDRSRRERHQASELGATDT